jgi:hypothetical protein
MLGLVSDPEEITSFESNGAQGHVSSQGFLSTRDSEITMHVLDILDGGETALNLRIKKYGRLQT